MTNLKFEDKQIIEKIPKRNKSSNNEIKKSPKKEVSKINKSQLINLPNSSKEISQTTNNIQPKKFSPEKKFYICQEVNKGPWTPSEDKLLTEYVLKFGAKRWHICAEFIKNRTGKQCREHWKNCLNPDLKKGNWTYEEDLLIMAFYHKCKGSWREMIHLFVNRTENSIKNRFFSQLRKIAANDSENEKKKRSSKIVLEHLIKYLPQGIEEAKRNFMRVNRMKEDDYNKYIKKMEIKFNNKRKDKKKKKGKKIEHSINKKNKYILLGKKREIISPEEIREKKSDNKIKMDIKEDLHEITKTTGLTNQNQNKEENKDEGNAEKNQKNNHDESKGVFGSYYDLFLNDKDDVNNNMNSFLEINNQMNIREDDSFIFSESNDEEKVDETFENSVVNFQGFFSSYEEEYAKRNNSDIISRISYNFFPGRKK